MSDIEVHVEIEGATLRAGTLYAHRRGRTEAATFDYQPGYSAIGGSYPLEPALDFRTRQHQTREGQKLFGAFADCAPDRWGRTLIQRAEGRRARDAGDRPRELTEVDYLLGVRDDLRQGALRFRESGTDLFLADGEQGIPALTQLGDLLELATRAERNSANYDELRQLVRAGSSLGGARPKAHVQSADGRIAIREIPKRRY